MLADNLRQVQANIEKACKSVGRNPSEVTLVAVSKTKPVDMLCFWRKQGSGDYGQI